jgi:hypothetical protein
MTMTIAPEWITLIFASNAMIASIAGPVVSTRIARTQFKANVLSVNRQKWIETMRDLIASLVAQLQTTAAVRRTVDEPASEVIARDPELLKRVENLLRTIAKIELMLSPFNERHQTLNTLMRDAVEELRTPTHEGELEEQIDAMSRDIVSISREILRFEWARVKRAE